MSQEVEIYDTTSRDGSQGKRVNFTTKGKLRVIPILDDLGIDYIELGWPGSNPTDAEAFQKAAKLKLKHATIVGFGATCKKGIKPQDDPSLIALIQAKVKVVTLFGKSSMSHVLKVLGTTPQENLRMIRDSCEFFRQAGLRVFFDAEHFFDGSKEDSNYALKTLGAAVEGGAERVILCDTNGGTLPDRIGELVRLVKAEIPVPLGIHCHNDCGVAVYSSVVAVREGAFQIQGTINGYGERCGNADLMQLIPVLQLKLGFKCLSADNMRKLTSVSGRVAKIVNMPPNYSQPFTGDDAFGHKAGVHVNAMVKLPTSYQHMAPELVGNISHSTVSQLSGRANIISKAKEFGIKLSAEQIVVVLNLVKDSGKKGFQFDGADGSLKLVMMRQLVGYKQPFVVLKSEARSCKIGRQKAVDSAIVEVRVNNTESAICFEIAEGKGTMNALDMALRKALLPHFPWLDKIRLVDYRLWVLDGDEGTAKTVKVLVDFSDGQEIWTTTGCSEDLIEANLQALEDGFEYAILKEV